MYVLWLLCVFVCVYLTISEVLGGVNKLLRMICIGEKLLPKLSSELKASMQTAVNDMQQASMYVCV